LGILSRDGDYAGQLVFLKKRRQIILRRSTVSARILLRFLGRHGEALKAIETNGAHCVPNGRKHSSTSSFALGQFKAAGASTGNRQLNQTERRYSISLSV